MHEQLIADPTSVTRAFLEACARGDADGARRLLADDVRWMRPADAGRGDGDVEVADWLASAVVSTEARGPRVLARVRIAGVRDGFASEVDQLLILTVRDGLIRRIDLCEDDPERVRRLWVAS